MVNYDEERRGLTSSGGAGPAGPAGQLSELARSLQDEPDVAGTLAVITAAAVSNIPGADYAAITLVTRGGRVSTPAASDTLIEAVEDLQNRNESGSLERDEQADERDQVADELTCPPASTGPSSADVGFSRRDGLQERPNLIRRRQI